MSTVDYRLEALKLAIQFGHPDEVVDRANAYLAFLLGGSADVATPPARTTKTKDAEKAKEEPKTATVEVADQPKAEEPEAGEAPAVDYSEVKRCILGISSKLGRDVATKLLGEFGVEKGPDLKPADYAEFVAKAEPMLSGAK